MEPITNMIQTRSNTARYTPPSLIQKGKKEEEEEEEAKLRTLASVSYSSTHQLPNVLPSPFSR